MIVLLLVDVDGYGKKDEVINVSEDIGLHFLQKNICRNADPSLLKILKRNCIDAFPLSIEEVYKIEKNRRQFEIKRRRLDNMFFNYITEYQIVEDMLFQYLIIKIQDDAIVKKSAHLSLVRLSEIVIRYLQTENISFDDVNRLQTLVLSLKRNELVHDKTIHFYGNILYEKNYAEKATMVNSEYEFLAMETKKLVELHNLIIKLEPSIARNIIDGRKRDIKASKIIKESFNIEKRSKDLIENVAKENNALNIVDRFLKRAFFQLISQYNYTLLDLREFLCFVAKRNNLLTSDEICAIETKTDLSGCIHYLKLLIKKNIIVYVLLENMDKVIDQLIEISKDRNYWVHYFYIEYIRNNKKDYFSDDSVDNRRNLFLNIQRSLEFVFKFNTSFEKKIIYNLPN